MTSNLDWLEYAVFYPDEDEEGFDGEHFGGVKGIKKNAPEWAIEAYKNYVISQKQGIDL